MSDNFFSRWSRRKQGIDAAEVTPTQPVKVAPPLEGSPQSPGVPAASAVLPEPPAAQADTQTPVPTMDDVQHLTPQSDFQGFMRQGVPGEVRNAAMKKLFTDPHFNVMDGLDIYIGDYNTPDPLPAGMLEKMVGAQLLGLFTPKDPNTAEGSPVVAQSPQPLTPPTPLSPPQPTSTLPVCPPTEHDDPDLQLQPNHAPASPSSGQSTG
jgi:hypothetical protein